MNEFKPSLALMPVCNFVGFSQNNPAINLGPKTDRANMIRTAASSLFIVFLIILSTPWVALAQSDQKYDPEARLASLGIKLPTPPSPVANYVNGVRTGNLIFLAGKGPMRPDGFELRGKLGKDLTIEQGYAAARSETVARPEVPGVWRAAW